MATVDLNSGRVAQPKPVIGATAADVRTRELSNDSLIVRLHFTINHLSRWLTPVHDRTKLERSRHRGDPSVKELLINLRDFELETFPKIHLIANKPNPNLDKLPVPVKSAYQTAVDEYSSPLTIMAEFRRVRQGTCSALRSLPDSAWKDVGASRREHDWQVRQLAEHLVNHDLEVLREVDLMLDRSGARIGVSKASRAHLDELMRLVPISTRVVS
jgi:hypothetical protein